jgi:hypothetical protein
MPSRVRAGSRRELDREHDDAGGEEGTSDHPASRRVQPTKVLTPPHSASVQRVNRPRVLCAEKRAVLAGGCSCAPLALESPQDLLGRGDVASGLALSVGVDILVDLQLGERRAVDGEVVGEAERERGEVLLRLAE